MQISNMDKVHAAGKAFFEALAEWDGEELQGSIITDLIAAHCTEESRLQLALHTLLDGHCNEFEEVTKAGKQFAVEMSEEMGPNNAQWLYHFAKLVTKLA